MLNPPPGKSQQGFHLVGVLVVILVLCAVGFVGFWVFGKNKPGPPKQHGPNYHALQACGDQPLTTMPMDLSRLEQIAALGGIDPPDHTLPTDHMYMMYPYGETTQKEIFAPADVVVTSIGFGGEYRNGELINADYGIDMYACSELGIRFSHMDTISDTLKAAIGQDFDNDIGCNITKQADKEIKGCGKSVDLKIPAGELLATSNGWDFWATYEGFTSPNVVSPAYYHNVNAVCPLDYFTDELKAKLYALVARDGSPKCGEAYQDKANTLQGGWFSHKDPNQAKTDWSSHFALAHDSKESGVGVLALASEDFTYRFAPRHSGSINREPSETTAGTIYCYEHEGDRRFPNGTIAGPGKVLLKLIDNHTMQLEHKDGTCAASESFSTPKTYYR